MEWDLGSYTPIKRVMQMLKHELGKQNKRIVKIINDKEHFHSALLESTSEVFIQLTKNQDKSLKAEQNIVKEIADLSMSLKAIKEEPKIDEQKKEVEQKVKEEHEIDKEIEEEQEEEKKDKKGITLSKNECMDLINSDDNIDELFGISTFNDGVIRFRIYADLRRNNLIENDIDNKIEFIEDNYETYVKASRFERGEVTNERKYPATKELMITLTKDVGNDVDRNVLEQYRRLFAVWLKPELDKHIFKISTSRPSKNHIKFRESIDDKMFNIIKFNEYLKDRFKIGLGYKDIALQPIMIPPNASDQLKRVFILLGSLTCGNDNPNILSEFSALLDQLYKDNKINRLLYKSLYYKGKNVLDKNLKK